VRRLGKTLPFVPAAVLITAVTALTGAGYAGTTETLRAVPAAATAGTATTTGTAPVTTSAPASSTTRTSSTTVSSGDGVPPGTVVRSWDFEDGSTAGWTPDSTETIKVSTEVALSGTHSLKVSGVSAYQDGAKFTTDTTGLSDGTWYDLAVHVRLGDVETSGFRAVVGTSWDPSPVVTNAGWKTVSVHFLKVSTMTSLVLHVFPVKLCVADWPAPAQSFYLDDVTVQKSTSQAAITWTTMPYCALTPTTTTPVTTKPPTTTTTTTTLPNSPTPPPTTTTTTPPTSTGTSVCTGALTVASQWPGAYQSALNVTTRTGLNGWTLTWKFPGSEKVAQLWGGSWHQDGSTVTVTSYSWNAAVPAGGSLSLGAIVTTSGSASPWHLLTLNGAACGGLAS